VIKPLLRRYAPTLLALLWKQCSASSVLALDFGGMRTHRKTLPVAVRFGQTSRRGACPFIDRLFDDDASTIRRNRQDGDYETLGKT